MSKRRRITRGIVSLAVLIQTLNAQELTPEPGPLAVAERYHLKMRKVFHEAFDFEVKVRAICGEQVFFIDGRNRLRMLASGEFSIRDHESRESIRTGETPVLDKDYRQIPPAEVELWDYLARVPEKVSDLNLKRLSRRASNETVAAIKSVWADALINARHPAVAHEPELGGPCHFSASILGRGVISATTWDPDEGSVAAACCNLLNTLQDFISHEANEDHVQKALWDYREATKSRPGGAAKISLKRPPAELSEMSPSATLSDAVVPTEVFVVDKKPLGEVLLLLEKLWKDHFEEMEIAIPDLKMTAVGKLAAKPVVYSGQPLAPRSLNSLKEILGLLADQVDAELHFTGYEVRLTEIEAAPVKRRAADALFDPF